MPIGNEMNGLQSQQKPHELQLVGLSVPFGQGGLNLRLAASYFLPSSHAIRFAAGFPGMMMVLSGMSSMEQMNDNLSYMKDFQPLNDAELTAVKKVQEIFRSKNLIPCTACRYCIDGCPKHISIPDLFAIMNTKQIYHDWNADYYYNVVHTAPGRKASDCLKCRKCEKVCPQHLQTRKLLEDVVKEFEPERA